MRGGGSKFIDPMRYMTGLDGLGGLGGWIVVRMDGRSRKG